MLASEIIDSVRFTLLDPSPGKYWSDEELIGYLNGYVKWACGLKPDVNVVRVVVNLDPGTDQVIPSDGHQFMDAHFAGNGQAVFVYPLEKVKHAKFANAGKLPAVANVQVVCADPRDPKRYHVFPQSDGTSASLLEIEYGAIPADMEFTSSGPSPTYPLGPETWDSAYSYVLALAYAKNTVRQDLGKVSSYYQRALAWFGLRTQAQFGEDPKPDQG